MSKQSERKSEKTENIERVVSINKVSKTVKGGRNFSFAALGITGDKNGQVGFGKGNASEVADARDKAFSAARKAMIKVSLKEGRTIHHDVTAKFRASKVYLRSAPMGTGVIAGGPLRSIFECAGISDVVAKAVGNSNPYNMVGAAFAALAKLASPKLIAERRSKDVSEIVRKRNLATSDRKIKSEAEV